MKLECSSCHYKFEAEKLPKLCPYCSAEGSVGLLRSAQDILDEANRESIHMDAEREERKNT